MRSLCRFYITVFCCVISFWALQTSAQVRLPQLIGDNMILQRDTRLNIWGWAAPNENVSIKFAAKNYKTITGADGKWKIVLSPTKAGGPYTMDIDASNHITLNNILLGDVWFCSGQSNMVLPMERVKEKYPEEIANANYPMIRNFFVPTASDVSQIHDDILKGKWLETNPQNALTFGAASYFFAQKLYEKFHVPIGIINSSVGGTPIQAWISADGLKQDIYYKDRVLQLQDTAYVNRQKGIVARIDSRVDISRDMDKGTIGPKKWYDTTYVPKEWHPFWLPGYWADQGIKDLHGVVWFRKEINLPASAAGQPAKLFMGRIVDLDDTYVNGVFCGSITYQYPPRRYTVPAGVLKAGKNIIVVRVVNNTAGKGGFVPEKPYNLVIGNDVIDLRGDWQYKVGQAFEPVPPRALLFSAQNEPTGLYNTMVAPAINYNIKGILWYQGENNADKPGEYNQLLPELIADWRSKCQNDHLPFIYVQLPNFMDTQYLPSESNWAIIREAELKALSIPNTGMAVSIDLGEWNDVHPLDKKDVGERLALSAEKVAYGDEQVVASGPIYRSAKIEGNKIIISFDDIGSGLMVKGDEGLEQFAIAGKDKKFVWANAIIEGDHVIVSSDRVPEPLYVRYAWADNPDGANLYNKEGLPASPFRTDGQ